MYIFKKLIINTDCAQQITRGIVEGKGKSLDCVVEVERGKKRRAKWLMKGSTMHVVDTILCVSWLLNLLHLTYESENNASAWAYEVFFFFFIINNLDELDFIIHL